MGRGFGVVEDVGRVEDEPERRDGAGRVEAAREVDATTGGRWEGRRGEDGEAEFELYSRCGPSRVRVGVFVGVVSRVSLLTSARRRNGAVSSRAVGERNFRSRGTSEQSEVKVGRISTHRGIDASCDIGIGARSRDFAIRTAKAFAFGAATLARVRPPTRHPRARRFGTSSHRARHSTVVIFHHRRAFGVQKSCPSFPSRPPLRRRRARALVQIRRLEASLVQDGRLRPLAMIPIQIYNISLASLAFWSQASLHRSPRRLRSRNLARARASLNGRFRGFALV